MEIPITLSENEIAQFCEEHHIGKLALFGSVLGDAFRQDSDVDVLVEFDPEYVPDLFDFVEMQDDLSNLLNRKVDLNTSGFLSRHFRQHVLDTAQVIYERKRQAISGLSIMQVG